MSRKRIGGLSELAPGWEEYILSCWVPESSTIQLTFLEFLREI